MATNGVQSSSSHMERHMKLLNLLDTSSPTSDGSRRVDQIRLVMISACAPTSALLASEFIARVTRRFHYPSDFPVAIRPPSRERSIQPPTQLAIAIPRAFPVQVWLAANWPCLDLSEDPRDFSFLRVFIRGNSACRSYRLVAYRREIIESFRKPFRNR